MEIKIKWIAIFLFTIIFLTFWFSAHFEMWSTEDLDPEEMTEPDRIIDPEADVFDSLQKDIIFDLDDKPYKMFSTTTELDQGNWYNPKSNADRYRTGSTESTTKNWWENFRTKSQGSYTTEDTTTDSYYDWETNTESRVAAQEALTWQNMAHQARKTLLSKVLTSTRRYTTHDKPYKMFSTDSKTERGTSPTARRQNDHTSTDSTTSADVTVSTTTTESSTASALTKTSTTRGDNQPTTRNSDTITDGDSSPTPPVDEYHFYNSGEAAYAKPVTGENNVLKFSNIMEDKDLNEPSVFLANAQRLLNENFSASPVDKAPPSPGTENTIAAGSNTSPATADKRDISPFTADKTDTLPSTTDKTDASPSTADKTDTSTAPTSQALLSTMKMYANQIQQRCSNLRNMGILNYSNTNPNASEHVYLMVSDKYRFMGCKAAKVGGTNLQRLVYAVENDIQDAASLAKGLARKQSLPMRLDSKENQTERLNTYTKFMIYRDPLERLVSAYRDHKPNGYFSNTNPGFVQYLTYFSAIDALLSTVRPWREIWSLCNPCEIEYDYILPLSMYTDGISAILSSLNVTSMVFPTREETNYREKSSQEVAQHFYSSVSDTVKETLKRKYAIDYYLFYGQNYFQV